MSDSTDNKAYFQLNLNRSRAPRAFAGNENLWEDDLGRIYRLIRRHADNLKARSKRGLGRRSSDRDDASHLGIAIFGPSGSGKSSLLRTLAEDIGSEKSTSIRQKSFQSPGQIYSLPPMDPTTWAPTDQFLYAFLASALEEERQVQEKKEHGYPQGLSPVQLAFQEVNEYLRVVDDPEGSEEYDPLGLSLQKLERHTSGLRLRAALGKFVEALANEIGSNDHSVVLLPIDDLDMAPGHLVQALEAYQSFLTHPRVVPVFTFTEMMPEELIEVEFRKRLGGEIRRQQDARIPVAQQMAIQFLSRCFPVRNRIKLGPAPARVQRAIFTFNAEDGSPKRDQEVLELLTVSSFLLFGHPDQEDAHQVRAALRPSTLRRQLQVVDAMADRGIASLSSPQFWRMGRYGNQKERWRSALPDLGKGQVEPGVTFDSYLWWQDIVSDGDPDKPRNTRFKCVEEEADAGWPFDEEFKIRRRVYESFTNNRPRLFEPPEAQAGQSLEPGLKGDFSFLAQRFEEMAEAGGKGSSWPSVFSTAAWSLLNVHRDALRELGLFLEDLYSWSPKELRSVVVDRILEQDRVTRRTVVDRWFNRTDYRRSQILSLLAANIFRPWMVGEEPYGDEELPIRRIKRSEALSKPDPLTKEQCLSFPASKGLLWFLNVTLGFYLPQIMARNWSDALSADEPVKGRISGNGWNLPHAPINAIRAADAKHEAFSFGMLFLDPRGYRHALESEQVSEDEEAGLTENWAANLKKLGSAAKEAEDWKKKVKKVLRSSRHASPRGKLMLRIWTCCGYSRGRFWAAVSLWRGLGFIGQVLEIGLEHEQQEVDKLATVERLRRLIRSHCLAGMVPGSLLDRNSSDELLLHGFPRWTPEHPAIEEEINQLACDLFGWLEKWKEQRIFPLPSGAVWIDWKDCFIRRVHGEYILGSLWPRLNSSYLEEQTSAPGLEELDRYQRCLARSRYYKDSELDIAYQYFPPATDPQLEHPEPYDCRLGGTKLVKKRLGNEEDLRWNAAVALGAWTDAILEYWRGCPPMLRLLLHCPAFLKSHHRFGSRETTFDGMEEGLLRQLAEPDTGADEAISKAGTVFTQQLGDSPAAKEALERFAWFRRLSIPPGDWKRLVPKKGKAGDAGRKAKAALDLSLVPEEFCIERVPTSEFTAREVEHLSLSLEPTYVNRAAGKNGEDELFARSIDRRRHREADERDRNSPQGS